MTTMPGDGERGVFARKFPTRCLYLLRKHGSVRKPAEKSDYHR